MRRILVFACSRANLSKSALPRGVRLIELPCIGRISTPLLLSAFARGVDGILVLGRHQATCRHNGAEDVAVKRIDLLRDILELVGLGAERLRFSEPPAGQEGPAKAVAAFAEEIEHIGPTPLESASPQELMLHETLDTSLALVEWFEARPELTANAKPWLARQHLPLPRAGQPILLGSEVVNLSLLANHLLRPLDLVDFLRSAQATLGFLGHNAVGIRVGAATQGNGFSTVFSLQPPSALLESSGAIFQNEAAQNHWRKKIITLDDLIRENGSRFPRPPRPTKVACDGSQEHSALLEALGYEPLDLGPDPLPQAFALSAEDRARGEARLAQADAEGATALLVHGPRELVRYNLLSRSGTWRSSLTSVVIGTQLAQLSMAQLPLTPHALTRLQHHQIQSSKEVQ